MTNILGPQAISVIGRILAFCTAIPFHESAHAYISDKLGDPTARSLGRLSLNPIRHLDPWGLIAMLTVGIGWAKPVPLNTGYYKNPKVGMALTAAAGPLSNLLLAFLNLIVYKVFYYAVVGITGGLPGWADIVMELLLILIAININLAIFNMLPIPPFDGSRIFSLFLPQRAYFAIQKYERYIMLGVIAVLFLLPRVAGINPLGWLLSTLNGYVLRGLNWITGFVDVIAAALR